MDTRERDERIRAMLSMSDEDLDRLERGFLDMANVQYLRLIEKVKQHVSSVSRQGTGPVRTQETRAESPVSG